MTLDEFFSEAAGHGPCVGVRVETTSLIAVPIGFELRTIEGARINTLDVLFDALGEAWDFPPGFASHRNKDAFDDWMRDFDNLTNPALDKPPAAGYITDITCGHLFLAEQSDVFSWFAKSIPFYRDYYRDDLDPPAAFGLLLSTSAGQLDQVRQRWLAAGVEVAQVST